MGVGMPDIFEDIFLLFSRVGSSVVGSDLHLNSLGPLNERCYMSRGFMLIMFYYTSIQPIFTDDGEV
jgi:hypothetical protein